MTPPRWDSPQSAFMLSSARSGSTALAHCLDSHPDIGWEREEPFSIGMGRYWNEVTRENITPNNILDYYLKRPGYWVSGCRLIYGQLKPGELSALRAFSPKVIHLIRRNGLRVVTSIFLVRGRTTMKKWGTSHSYADVPADPMIVPPLTIISALNRWEQAVNRHIKLLEELAFPVLTAYYEDLFVPMLGRSWSELRKYEAIRLCKFLGVEYLPPLTTRTRRVNPQPLSEIYGNWDEIEARLKHTRHAILLEDEIPMQPYASHYRFGM